MRPNEWLHGWPRLDTVLAWGNDHATTDAVRDVAFVLGGTAGFADDPKPLLATELIANETERIRALTSVQARFAFGEDAEEVLSSEDLTLLSEAEMEEVEGDGLRFFLRAMAFSSRYVRFYRYERGWGFNFYRSNRRVFGIEMHGWKGGHPWYRRWHYHRRPGIGRHRPWEGLVIHSAGTPPRAPIVRPWNEYKSIILQLLEVFRNDDSRGALLRVENALTDMPEYATGLRIHLLLVETMCEKPSVRDLDALRKSDLMDHEFDQTLESIRQSDSYAEATQRAVEIWEIA